MRPVGCNWIFLVYKLDKFFAQFNILLENNFKSSWNLSFALVTCHGCEAVIIFAIFKTASSYGTRTFTTMTECSNAENVALEELEDESPMPCND